LIFLQWLRVPFWVGPGVPDDVARVVLFLVSEMADWITGATIPVDAGKLAN